MSAARFTRVVIAAVILAACGLAAADRSSTPALASVTGPWITVGNPRLVNGHVLVDVNSVFGTPNAYDGFNTHLRWNPAVFSFASMDATGGLFDPNANPATGFCAGPDTTTFDSDGGGVTFGCAGFAGTTASNHLLATVALTPAVSGCSAIHLVTYGAPDGGDELTGTYTVNAADTTPQVNRYYNTTSDVSGHACSPGAGPSMGAPTGPGGALLASGNCAYDINRNGKIDLADLILQAGAYNHHFGDLVFPIWADVNVDGVISLADLIIVSGQYNRTVSGCTQCRIKTTDQGRQDDGPTHHYVGWVNNGDGGPVGGVWSTILNYSPWVYQVTWPGDSYPDHSVAWVALGQNNSMLAQIGWWAYPYGDQHTFYEWIDSSGIHLINNITPDAIGSSSTYTVLYDNTPNNFTFQDNGVTIALKPTTFVPNQAEIAAETHTLASQYPGGAFNPVTMSGSQAYYGGGPKDFNGTPFNDPYSDKNKVSTTQIKVWDTGCGF